MAASSQLLLLLYCLSALVDLARLACMALKGKREPCALSQMVCLAVLLMNLCWRRVR
jgi:hypothetical protein